MHTHVFPPEEPIERIGKIQDSSSLIVTYTYKMCNEMKKWQCPVECATEQYTITNITNSREIIRISTLFRVFTAKRAALFFYR